MNDNYNNNIDNDNNNVSDQKILDYLNQEDETVISTAEHFDMLPNHVNKLYQENNHNAYAIKKALSWDEWNGYEWDHFLEDRIRTAGCKDISINKQVIKKICYKLNSLSKLAIISMHSKEPFTKEEQEILKLLYNSQNATITNIAEIYGKSKMEILDIYLRGDMLTCAVYDVYCRFKYGKKYNSFKQFYKSVKFEYEKNYGEIDNNIFEKKSEEEIQHRIKHILQILEANEILKLPDKVKVYDEDGHYWYE